MGEPISLFAKSEKHLAKIQAEDTALIIFNFKNKKQQLWRLQLQCDQKILRVL